MMDDDSSERVFLDARTTAHRYGITTKTLQRWVHNPDTGFPQPRTIGNRWYFHLPDLERWEVDKK